MSFYVYENWPTSRAIVHRAKCSYSNDGRGVHPGASDHNGRWLPAFGTFREALTTARRTGARVARPCRRCNPSD